MSKPGNIFYSPKDGFRTQAGLNIKRHVLDQFEYSWQCCGDYGDFRINKTEIRPGFEIWITDCLIRQNIRFSVDDHPSTFSFSFYLSGSSSSQYCTERMPIEISAGKQGVFYCPNADVFSLLKADQALHQVEIIISPECMHFYFESVLNLVHSDLRKILEQNRDDLYYNIQTITPAMQAALQQLIHCPFRGLVRKLFFESRALELMSYQLDQISNTESMPELKGQCLHPGDRKRIERVRDILLSNIENPPGLCQLSRDAGMSHPKLNRCFRQQYGMTVFEYIRKERLKRAKEMINQGLNVTEAAYSVGYESISHFSQAFKKHFGMSPSNFVHRN